MTDDLHINHEAIYNFLLNNLNERLSIEGFAYEPIKIGGVYWTLTAISLLKGKVNDILHPKLNVRLESIALDIIEASKNPDGGFGNGPGHPSSIIATHYAILSLALLGKQDVIDKECTIKYVSGLQNRDGSFNSDHFGEADARHVYSGVICLSVLGGLDTINMSQTVDFLLNCQNPNGGFGWYPEGESHGAATFCCVGALSELGALHLVDTTALGIWLSERQTPGGGCNGRAEKAPDICYSWWVISALTNIGRSAWFDKTKLTEFICRSQNRDDGGIAYFPGYIGDVFHTFFALAALSLIDHKGFGLEPIHARYATTSYGWKVDNFNKI
uniref:Geranylgeranyl transferase type-2 subunit beta n=1 Tax=Babesia bovis TaxID=5865 RepID=S6B145_BABBO|nr:geranylgeranyl transferase type II beta subunit, putative [Babesia bovis]